MQLVDQQIENIVGGVDHPGVGQAAAVLAQQRPQHPVGTHHLVAANLPVAELAHEDRRYRLGAQGDPRVLGLGCGRRVDRPGHHPDQQLGIVGIARRSHLQLRGAAVPDQLELSP